MYTTTMEMGLNDLGEITGGRLNAVQQYSIDRCIELAKLNGYTLGQFIHEFIEDKHPELKDAVFRCWNMV